MDSVPASEISQCTIDHLVFQAFKLTMKKVYFDRLSCIASWHETLVMLSFV